MEEMNVIERKFAVGEVKSGIELLNGLAVSGGIVEMDLSIAVRVGLSTRGLQEKIGRSGDGIVESGERLQRGKVGVVKIGADGKSAVAGDVAVLKRGGGIELS